MRFELDRKEINIFDWVSDSTIARSIDASKILLNNSIKFTLPKITRVIFNDPATIIFWDDSTKTVVKATNEPFDKEKGIAMAIAKKALGNKGNYYNVIRPWLGDK